MSERIKLLDDLGAEFARAFAEAERPARVPRLLPARARALPIALAIVAALGGTAYAVPATRDVVDDITAPLADWVSGGDDAAPGRAVAPGDHAPGWLRQADADQVRLIAETEGVGLYVRKIDSAGEPSIGFSLGPGRGITGTLAGWRERLDRRTIYVLGDALYGDARGALDDRGRVPLFGVTTRDVARVELRYADGPPLAADNGDGGFVLLVDAWRPMREIVGYDASGQVVGRADVSGYRLRYLCEREPGCPTAG